MAIVIALCGVNKKIQSVLNIRIAVSSVHIQIEYIEIGE